MNRFSMMTLAVLLGAACAWGRPALKGVASVAQPDGSTVSVKLVGDEYLHYHTTADGYTLTVDDEGFYVYAQVEQGKLVPTAMRAHDEGTRSAAESAFLSALGRQVPAMSRTMEQTKRRNAVGRQQALQARRAGRYDYANFKGLVLLVEFNDCQFSHGDYADIMEHMLNDDNYTGSAETNFYDGMFYRRNITCVGSMRDYFRDNSSGIFVPTFDIVGPVQIDRSQFDASDNSYQLMIDACTAADSQVDFSQYDVDNDGTVDMIYFIFAGLPSYIQGNDQRLLWPHQSDLSYARVKRDGVTLGRYACSTELFGYQAYNWSVLEGIGTMCHEFSHVLGLPDFYDTGNQYQGTCVDPGEWSLMANGADYDYGRRPCAYSLFERYALGFAQPQTLTAEGSYTLENLSESNTGYRINTPVKDEFFMLENRQNTKWDLRLPGHGMLVFRADSSNVYAWTYYNTVNDDPSHPLYELVRAHGAQGSLSQASDPFPGTFNVTQLDNTTSPANLLTWAGKNSPWGLTGINESGGVISFDVFDANRVQEIIIPGQVMLGVSTTMQMVPEIVPSTAPYSLTWAVADEQVATVSQTGLLTGVGEGQTMLTVTNENGVAASCAITVKQLPVADNIASMLALGPDAEALVQLTDARVLYSYDSDIYLRDASGSIVLSGTGLAVQRNDVLSGSIYVRLSLRNQMPILMPVEGLTNTAGITSQAGTAVEPLQLHISQLTEQRYAELVSVGKVQLVVDGGVFAYLGDRRIRLYNPLKVSGVKVPTDLTKRYNVTAIFGTDVLNGQVIDELYLLSTPTPSAYTELQALTLPEALALPVGRVYQFEPALVPASADRFLRWSSSDETVAVVDQQGVVTALGPGQATISVTNLDNGLTAQCLLTVGQKLTVSDFAALKALGDGAEAELTLSNAQVVWVYKQDAYVRDASAALRFHGTGLQLKAGDVLNGTLYGQLGMDGPVPQLLPVEGFTQADSFTLTEGGDVAPREVPFASLGSNDFADLIVLRGVQLSQVGGLTGIYVADGNHRVRLYNDFAVAGVKVPTNYAGKYFDVTGVLTSATVLSQQVDNLSLVASPVEVEKPQESAIAALSAQDGHAPVAVYTADGRLLVQTTADQFRLLRLQPGIYVVKSGSSVVRIVKR